MNSSPSASLQDERNPKTAATFRRTAFWQITLPLLIGLGLFLGGVLGVALSTQPHAEVSQWADAASLWLMLPWLLVTLLVLAFFSSLVFLLARLLSAIPPFAFRIQRIFSRIAGLAQESSDRIAEPIVRYASFWAGVRTLLRRL